MVDITDRGVTGKTLQEYRDDISSRYLEIDPEWTISPESPDGQQIGIWSETLALLDEMIQYAYMSRDPSTAQGLALDDIAAYAGIRRQGATNSTAEIVVRGLDGTVIPAGSRVRNANTGSEWSLDFSVTINGDTSTLVTAVEPGAKTAAIGDLSVIANPVAGWQSVTNIEVAARGRDRESDARFRSRRSQSVSLPGSNQVDNITSSVANVAGVLRVKVYENPEDSSDSNGLLPHSIAIFAQGGEAAEVMDVISKKKNPGCGMNRFSGFPNTISEDITTPVGNPVNITFFRPEPVSIFVDVDISNTTLSISQQSSIKKAIVDYAQRGYDGLGDGFARTGYSIGERVGAGRLYTPVNEEVAGNGLVESITVGTSSEPAGSVVPIDFNQLAVFDESNIRINYV